MKHSSHFPPALGRALYYVVLAALGLLVLLVAAGLAQLPASTSSAGHRGSAPGGPLGCPHLVVAA